MNFRLPQENVLKSLVISKKPHFRYYIFEKWDDKGEKNIRLEMWRLEIRFELCINYYRS